MSIWIEIFVIILFVLASDQLLFNRYKSSLSRMDAEVMLLGFSLILFYVFRQLKSDLRMNPRHKYMDRYCRIVLSRDTPIVTAAIHNGHRLSNEIEKLMALSGEERLREEDPCTGKWARTSRNHIIGRISRFEFDLNRPPEKAVYLTPEDAWGLQVWKTPPSREALERLLSRYNEIYTRIHEGLSDLIEKFGTVVVLDLHSYNHRRGGAAASPADPLQNPEINIGTGTLDREYWAFLVEGVMEDLKKFDFQGRQLDVRENTKFRGGNFPRWIHENFDKSVCCISLEVKKFFMDEWTGKSFRDLTDCIGASVRSLFPGIHEKIAWYNSASKTDNTD